MTEKKKINTKKQAYKPKKSTAKSKSTGTYKKTEPKKGGTKKKVATKSVKHKEQPQPKPKKETYPHFRYYLKSKHPALIVGEQPVEEYRYRKVMHVKRDGGRLNEEIEPNPNPKDKRPMYIGKRVRHDKKINFVNYKLPWKYPKK